LNGRPDTDLHFVVEAFREQRAQRAVDQARDQRFAFRRTAFAAEEATGDLAGCVGLFEVVDRQREEVLARLGGLGADHGGQHNGIFDVDNHSTACLTSDFARFETNVMLSPLKFFDDFIEHSHFVTPSLCRADQKRRGNARTGATWEEECYAIPENHALHRVRARTAGMTQSSALKPGCVERCPPHEPSRYRGQLSARLT
jgi:hypothetical protein